MTEAPIAASHRVGWCFTVRMPGHRKGEQPKQGHSGFRLVWPLAALLTALARNIGLLADPANMQDDALNAANRAIA